MKLLVSAVLAVCLLTPAAHADEASKRVKVEEMFALLHLDALMQQIREGAIKQADSVVSGMVGTQHDLSSKQQADVTEFDHKLLALLNAQVSWPAVKGEMTDLYARTFTEAQIDDLIAFYQSPTGQVLLAKTPELTQAAQQISISRMRAIQPQLEQAFRDFAAQIAADTPAHAAHPGKPAKP